MPTLMPTFLDHAFFLVLIAVIPLLGHSHYRELQATVLKGESINRCNLYQKTIMQQWVLWLVCMGIWLLYQRSWPLLGFGLELDRQFWLGAAIALVSVGYCIYTCIKANTLQKEQRDKILRSIEQHHLQALLPSNHQELRWYYALSITAGIVEETIWRGFMWWYLIQWLPIWAAALVAIASFGIIHLYQGISGAWRTGAVGAVLLGIYLLTGSLWVPILLHALGDIFQGRMLYTVLKRDMAEQSAT